MAAELGSHEQAHTSLPPVSNFRVEESPASFKELGSRAQSVHEGESNYL